MDRNKSHHGEDKKAKKQAVPVNQSQGAVASSTVNQSVTPAKGKHEKHKYN